MQKGNIIVEKITKNNINLIDDIYSLSLKCFYTDSWNKVSLKDTALSENGNILVALLDNKLVGFIVNSCHYDCDLYLIAVENQYRKNGIGNILINNLIHYCKSRFIKKIILEVRKSNTNAINFYKNIGFTVVGERKNFYNNPLENAILMDFLI